MGKEILTDNQKKALAAVAREPALRSFYLTGGTALAEYYLHHRHSDDLDFFTSEELDQAALNDFSHRLKELLESTNVRFERRYDRYQFFFALGGGELKIEFTKYPFRHLENPCMMNGVFVDSIADIAANKIMTILDRLDPKDFVDLFFILPNMPLATIRQNVEKKFGITTSDITMGAALAQVRRIEALPIMVRPLTIEELKDFFTEQARGLEGNIFK